MALDLSQVAVHFGDHGHRLKFGHFGYHFWIPLPQSLSNESGFPPELRAIRKMFAHEKLEVYRKALRFVAAISSFVTLWDKKHA